ncbi:restriction endonuclease subunit S [Xanthomonas sp. LMG 12460]|uniref:restriction endonuclease subunit S n=1 Tax=Xanthomonas sp. LMG 12460 TaxID=1591132 RepID=UPI001265916E|nr:restriction endonuclease subunit S [Xanthomonas sp. LMG 12460]KAB7775301.1 restriction endonuclease [Xanthomonas sp. LMG 12460]
MSEPQIDIRPDHWAIVRDILQRHVPQYAVWAFGSRAKWTAKEFSDLDLAIITDSPLPLATSAALAEDFSESDLPWKVDIVDWAETSETFRKIIERDRIVLQEVEKNGAAGKEWREVLLGEVANLMTGYPFKSQHYTDSPTAPRLIGGDNIAQGRLRWDNTRRWPSEMANGLDDYWLKLGDIVLAMDRPWIEAGLKYATVGSEDIPLLLVQRTARLRGSAGLDTGFLRYIIAGKEFTQYILSVQTGTVVPHISPDQIRAFRFLLPPLGLQKAIANALSTLDDRIELNRRMKETLESMAGSLFKSWFVDFDGVATENLQESELGSIPQGWQVASLDSIADYLNGLALQRFPPESESEFLPVIKIAQLRAGNTNNADKASSQLKSEYIVEDGDVLFSWSGSLEVEVWTGGRGALNQHLFKVTSGKVPKWFYYFATRQYLADFRAIAASKATTMGHIQRKHLTDAKIAVPSPEAMESFDCTIAPLFEQMIKTSLQSKALAQLRDTLLPKLMSGEVRIKDAERLAETA